MCVCLIYNVYLEKKGKYCLKYYGKFCVLKKDKIKRLVNLCLGKVYKVLEN